MGVVNETVCAPLHKIALAPAYLAVTMPALVSPIACIALIFSFLFRFFRRGCYHVNAKILFFCQLFFTTLYCTVFLYTHGVQLLYTVLLQQDDPCAAVVYAGECTMSYYSITISVTGMVATQVSIGIERIVSTLYARNYEKFGMSLGLCLASFAILLSLGVSLIVLSNVDATEVRLTCMGVPSSAGDRSRLLYYVIIACDIVTMALFVVSFRLNRKHNYTEGSVILVVKYQQKENRNVIRMLFPNVIAHCIVYCTFSITAFIIRTNKDSIDPMVYTVVSVAINLIPHYSVVEMVVLHLVLTQLDRKAEKFRQAIANHRVESEEDVYFAEYVKAWN